MHVLNKPNTLRAQVLNCGSLESKRMLRTYENCFKYNAKLWERKQAFSYNYSGYNNYKQYCKKKFHLVAKFIIFFNMHYVQKL